MAPIPLASTREVVDGGSLFPDSLWEILEPPGSFYVQGQPEALSLFQKLPEFGFAVVGTRRPQMRSLNLVRSWIKKLKGTGLIIVSGLAAGVDGMAHSAALEAGLKTIAVLGCGFNFEYPVENRELRRRILENGGLIVSEYSPETPPLKHQFIRRNRIIAGWSKATWVVEAPYRSGSLNTAKWARDQDRYCFAVPGFPGDPSLGGNQILLDRDHAIPTWGVHSFGVAWLDLATLSSENREAGGVSKRESQSGKRTSSQNLPSEQTRLPRLVPGLKAGVQEGWTGLKNPGPLCGGEPLRPEGRGLPRLDEELLFQYLKQMTAQTNGTPLLDLLAWASARGWARKEFFASLECLHREGRIFEKLGSWMAI